MKLVGFGEAVNVSLGLPILRTSVDHGTAYDIAGTGRADARGMAAAMDLAVRLARPRVNDASARTPRKRPPRRTDRPR
jgi:4-hydroxythreonine-4-phosphate dehydrogenase